MNVAIEINTFARLRRVDPLRYETAAARTETVGIDRRRIVYCEAFDEENYQVGRLALAPDGLILTVEVAPEHRRKGIATLMYEALVRAGYAPRPDWENMRDDGAAWAASVGGE